MLLVNWFKAFFVGLIYGINYEIMLEKSINRLGFLCDIIPAILLELDDAPFTSKPHTEKWSRKEIIGHLIDSAANNHQRFVRGQFEEDPTIIYNPDDCNKHNYYSKISGEQIVKFWEIYNCQILQLIKNIPSRLLRNKVNTGSQSHTIEYLFIDYVEHMEHHLKQVIDY